MQPVHPPGCDGLPLEPTISKIGVNRYNEAYAWRSIKDAGVTVTFSTDWPVSNVDPINAISNALNRQKWSEETIDQRLNLTETLKDSTEVLKRLPELPQIMDKANQALTFLASGQIPQNSNSYSALKDKEMEMKSFRNQSIIGLLLLVFFGYLVF